MKTTYKAVSRFQGHEPGEEFKADLDPGLEQRAIGRGQIKKVDPPKKKEEDKSG